MSEPHGDKGTEERTISTYYEFSPSSVNTQWRRTLVIKSSKEGTKSMVQSGTLVGIDQDQITLEINDSSCDQDRIVLAENPQKINIYYKRKGSQLTFSTQPIPPTENSGSDLPIGERLVATVTKAMVHSTQIFLQELFTFGGARSYLETTDIELDQAPALKPENRGELGCFENVGSGFTPFKTQP